MAFEKRTEDIILEAMARGDFDHLTNAGKPIDLSSYFNTPAEMRAAYSILKNAGILPHEVELFQEIADLKLVLFNLQDGTKQKSIHQMLQRKKLELSLIMERNKGGK